MIPRLNRSKAIRLKCLDCCCDNAAEVRRCVCKDCTLWPFRLGREDSSEYADEDKAYLEERRKKKSDRVKERMSK